MSRNEMIEQLRLRECRVIFKKIDGEERDMKCTLQENVLPEKKFVDKGFQVGIVGTQHIRGEQTKISWWIDY